ncbi:MAG: hypothetical protein L7A77_05865 [Xylella fastidiosa subsp. multiplex]|nr:hypothetical protein [Xylella fastidiosa subsp. multiplex]MCP8324419.1 hypothetical protein [Xylella fastidiosa subsp. multiplex]
MEIRLSSQSTTPIAHRPRLSSTASQRVFHGFPLVNITRGLGTSQMQAELLTIPIHDQFFAPQTTLDHQHIQDLDTRFRYRPI